ncbi:MAG: hypothetical protein COA54_06610 [Thiotrichaceae bacterium]|nr:MAG: hypothetical protein COA54_06610 [Thiotrichaceae bacterium]
MKIDEAEALSTAMQFARDEHKESNLFIDEEKYTIIFEEDGFGRTVLELDENYWVITFTLNTTGESMFDSGSEYFVVLVGAESGEPHWLPMM